MFCLDKTIKIKELKTNATTKASLLKLVSPFNYQTKTGKTTLLSVDTQAEITVIGQNKRFWITDFVPVIYNSVVLYKVCYLLNASKIDIIERQFECFYMIY